MVKDGVRATYELLLGPNTGQERVCQAPRQVATDMRVVHGAIIATLRSDSTSSCAP
jgi:hypothetical protein